MPPIQTIELDADMVVELLVRRGERFSSPRLIDAAERCGVPFRRIICSESQLVQGHRSSLPASSVGLQRNDETP